MALIFLLLLGCEVKKEKSYHIEHTLDFFFVRYDSTITVPSWRGIYFKGCWRREYTFRNKEQSLEFWSTTQAPPRIL